MFPAIAWRGCAKPGMTFCGFGRVRRACRIPPYWRRHNTEGRLLITFDKDFGDLVFRQGAEASHGVVLFRIPQPSSAVVAERVTHILASRDDWEGHYSVVDETAVRIRPLPRRR